MKLKELIEKLNELTHIDLQEEWDNSGIQIATDFDKEIDRVMTALEVTGDIIEEAVQNGIDLIVTHHPLYFGSVNSITPDILPTRYSIELIKEDISVYSAHTNFDSMEGGNNDYIADILGFTRVENIGIFRSGELSESLSVIDLRQHISEKLSIPLEEIRLIGDVNRNIKRIAWCTGSGMDYMMDAYDLGVDAFITGDVKYHDARTVDEFKFCVLDIGHFGSEKIFTKNMADILTNNLPEIEVIESERDSNPFHV